MALKDCHAKDDDDDEFPSSSTLLLDSIFLSPTECIACHHNFVGICDYRNLQINL
jgi:hypothetical protein